MTTTTVKAGSTNNNNGVAILGGNVASTGPIATVYDKEFLGAGRKNQPGPYVSATLGNQKSVSAGTFGGQTAGEYVVKGGKITTTLAGVSNTTLEGGANDVQQRPINFLNTRRTVRIDSWNYVTGAPTFNIANPSNDSFGADHAAAPTAAIPGELIFIEDGVNAELKDYAARTSS